MVPEMEFFIFALEQKLDQHSCVQFHGESDSDGFNFLKTQTNPHALLVPPKMKFFNCNFGLEQKSIIVIFMINFKAISMAIALKPNNR